MNTVIMDNLQIAGTPCTPCVEFRFDAHMLALEGESYPENAAAFYGPLIARTRDYIATLAPDANVEVHVSLAYFNSSSTKMLFSFFDTLNEAAESGVQVALHWYHDRDDDTIEEFGQELHIDFPALNFHDHALD